MSAEQLVNYLTWAVYFSIFVITAARAIRYPRRVNIDIALFFTAPAFIIVVSALSNANLLADSPFIGALMGSILLLIAYLLLRLLDDFTDIPRFWVPAAGLAWLLLSLPLFFLTDPPLWLTLLQIGYFVGLQLYAALLFVREARHANGVTRRRLRAIAVGSLFLGLAIFVLAVPPLFPPGAGLARVLFYTSSIASAISYFIGFAPPGWLRRAWQEPELRAFFGRAASLPRLPSTEAIVRELELGAASSIGAANAHIGLWDATEQLLVYRHEGQARPFRIDLPSTTADAYNHQRARFSAGIPDDDSPATQMRREFGAHTVLAAPITAGDKQLGVLTVYAARAPIFADDDLELIQLLADQAAVILESRTLIDEAARVQAREEMARMKDDFLSVAAHDLKTPLTTLVGQAQLLERRALRQPDAPVDLTGIQRLLQEAMRLRSLVLDLLDASRAEQGKLVGHREPVDLVPIIEASCHRLDQQQARYTLHTPSEVVGEFDRNRIVQLVDNLLENAAKYSADGTPIDVTLNRNGHNVWLTVKDRGIGIPPEDLPHVFDRFYRAHNVDARQHTGMGLGLFICRGIAEQHGGRIWAESHPNQGSSFHVELPLTS